jgi:cell fate regulator YaaT (PSP1 superfamily)
LRKSDKVVIRSSRGVEAGEVVTKPLAVEEGRTKDSDGEILRKFTDADEESLEKIEEVSIPNAFKLCQKKIKEHGLQMKLASVEHLFGSKKMIFCFLAEGRVDFRELVKDLAKEYQTRIEMKQIGVRDEARLLADYEHCGRELCCRTFLKNLEPVTMKMAKNQKTTLDPSKVSGRCGRLMCCLRYEDKTYDELRRNLPKKGTVVNTANGSGEVIDYDVLCQLVTVETEKGKRVVFSVEELSGCSNKSCAKEGACG